MRPDQTDLFGYLETAAPEPRTGQRGTFTDNMRLPIHRWFRYSAGFSAEWVGQVVAEAMWRDGGVRVLDPFCGSGTTLIAATRAGAAAVGLEPHPFVARIAEAKVRHADPGALLRAGERLLERAQRRPAPAEDETPTPALLRKCYSREHLVALQALGSSLDDMAAMLPAEIGELLWLAITAILRECSGVGTAQWQYVLPNKTKAKVGHPFAAFQRRVRMFAGDLHDSPLPSGASATVLRHDARAIPDLGSFDLVVTSPPYPNNYDYADATRLEMTFWGEVESWSDLHGKVRRHLIRACSQHASAERLHLPEVLQAPRLDPIRDDIAAVCDELAQLREERAGRKAYHTMVAAYFSDLADVWAGLRRAVRKGGTMAVVIGDSAPYGVHVPCDDWLGRLALAAGFHGFRFEKLRDRNTKWKNRKHTVPLHEGILWIDA